MTRFKIQSLWNTPFKKDVFFVLTLIACFFIYRYEYLLRFEPSGPHTWRQADCVSMIDNYYSHGLRFFWPEIHYQISDGDQSGYTAGEFPGLYYVNALLWTVFGKHIAITRALSILIMFIGLFALYKTYLFSSKNYFWSVICPLLLLSTPAMAEYGANFLTDVPGFSFALMGWYFFVRFKADGRDSLLLKASVLFMFAGLLKVSSLILFVVISLIWMLELVGLRFSDSTKPIFQRPIKQGFFLGLAVLGILSWYYYASYFNSVHVGKYTFNSPWPIWSLTQDHIVEIAKGFWGWTSVFTMPVIFWYVAPVLIVMGIFLIYRLSVFYRLVFILTLMGVIGYFALWFQAIDQHDYYFVNGFVILVVLPMVFFDARLKPPLWLTYTFKTLGLCALLYGLIYTRQNLELRHYPEEQFAYPLMPAQPVSLMKWYHWERTTRIRGLRKIQPLLDSLGVDKSKKVVIMPDATINHTLYLVDRRGWTSFGDRPKREIVESGIQHGAEFLIVIHPDIYLESGMAVFKNYQIGKLDNADIIDLKKFVSEGSPG